VKKLAVVGIGAIGGIVGQGLAVAGKDVTLVCTSWRANVVHLKEHGLTVVGPNGVERTAAVRALFIDELAQLPGKIDVLFVATKSNDTQACVTALEPHLAADGVVVSLQNGMNDDLIVPIVGPERVAACVSYTGGVLVRPGHVRAHGGRFVVGELDGRVSARILELAELLGAVAPTEVSTDIVGQRWDKLAQVTTTVPVGAISGVGFPAILQVERAHPLMARLMRETLAVAAAAGHPLAMVAGLTAADWRRLAAGPAPELSRAISEPFAPRPEVPAPDPDEAPLLKDLKLGLPLEIDHTNGYVIARGRELGVPTPTHDLTMALLKTIQEGKAKPGLQLLEEVLERSEATRT
jgi:2-dehydropantoate 2-reductase